ncbi:MAG TPA: hypothetical protein VFX02_07365 [Gammaproteobacteria bacterium]|nr:hypothetical protein [Gammaproteobacteria bacterium]
MTGTQLLVGGLAPLMGSVTTTGTAGISTNNQVQLSCQAGYVVSGLKGRIGNNGSGPIEQLALTCVRMFGNATVDTSSMGPATGTSVPFSNPSCLSMGERVATGIRGHFTSITGGTNFERVQLNCR